MATVDSQEFVYKILRPREWTDFERSKVFTGSVDDRRDGFIHLSFREQVSGTLVAHFADEPLPMVLEFRVTSFGSALKVERSRRGELFPHLYGPLRWVDICARHDARQFVEASCKAEVRRP